jgi:hypothetical protein
MNLPPTVSCRVAYCAIILAAFTLPPAARATSLKLSSKDLQFGNVVVGQTRSLSATLTNTGKTPVKISTIHSSVKAFAVANIQHPFTLPAGHHVAVLVQFRPQGVGQVTGDILFDNTVARLAVQGRGVGKLVLRASPPHLAFGDVQVGDSRTLRMAVSNAGTSSVQLAELRPDNGFTILGLNSPLTLEAGHSFTFSVTFAPRKAGVESGNLIFADLEHQPLVVGLHGTGTDAGHLADSPAMDFGDVSVGESATRSGTLTATAASVTVQSAASNSPEFVVSGLSFPVTIAAGRSVHYTVKFTPQKTGTASASLSFASSASDRMLSESLTGSGVVRTHVNLFWDASRSHVAGYDVYRGARSGGPYTKINRALDAATKYTDESVMNGHTYYYVVAAVNSKGQISEFSNQTTAMIP